MKLRMMEVVVTTGTIRHAELQSNHHHHQQTNVYRLDALPPRPANSIKALKEKVNNCS